MPGEIGLDWLSVVGEEETRRDVENHLDALFGEPGRERRAIGRQGFYEQGTAWPNGTRLQWGHREKSAAWLANIPGGACTEAGTDAVVELARQIMLGGRCTRVDIRLDLTGDYRDFIGNIVASCDRGEHCLVRSYEPMRGHGQDASEYMGEGVYLGDRRNSKRFIRVYDKGLEQRTRPRGEWVRFEAQIRKEFANIAVMDMLSVEYWATAARAHLLGVAEFREVTGQTARARRPLVKWWADFVAGVETARPAAEPRVFTMAAYKAWLQNAVAPALTAAGEFLDLTPGEVFDELIRDPRASVDGLKSPAAAGIVRHLAVPH